MKLRKLPSISVSEENATLDFMRESINVRLSTLTVSLWYNCYVVGAVDKEDSEEGTLIFVPNISPEKLGIKK